MKTYNFTNIKTYNGFSNAEDYQFIADVVRKTVDGNDKVSTWVVTLNEKGEIRVTLGIDTIEEYKVIAVTFEQFESLKKAVMLTDIEGGDWHKVIERLMPKRLNEVIVKEVA